MKKSQTDKVEGAITVPIRMKPVKIHLDGYPAFSRYKRHKKDQVVHLDAPGARLLSYAVDLMHRSGNPHSIEIVPAEQMSSDDHATNEVHVDINSVDYRITVGFIARMKEATT